MGLPKYPKILPLGHRVINKMYDGDVELTEKVDGSQFRFGLIKPPGDRNERRKWKDFELNCGTKRTMISLEAPDNLFVPAVEHVKHICHKLPTNIVFFGETLMRPKHNVIKYDTVPKNHIALFAGMMDDKRMIGYHELQFWATELDVDVVPRLYQGPVEGPDQIIELLNTESYLGGHKIEGVVAKNYNHDAMLGDGHYYPYLVGKYVSEEFKERMHSRPFTRKQTLMEFFKSFGTEARWNKAIQHLRDEGKLTGEPKDIGPLLKEMQQDFIQEHKEEVMQRLWKEYSKQVMHHIIKGFPEWYKEKILRGELNV